MSRRRRGVASLGTVVVMLTLVATRVQAATLDGSAAALSDYRFRGVSLSDRQPVGEAAVDVTAGAWFAGVEGVTASRPRNVLSSAATTPEIDLSGGWSRAFGLLTPAVGVIGYVHPGGETANAELFASLAGSLGPATMTVGANFAPDQAAAPQGNLYVFARAAAGIPATPLTFRAGVGREAGAYAGGRAKIDWSAGVEARAVRVVTIGLDYVGNNAAPAPTGRLQANRSDGIVVRARVSF